MKTPLKQQVTKPPTIIGQKLGFQNVVYSPKTYAHVWKKQDVDFFIWFEGKDDLIIIIIIDFKVI